MAKRGVLTVRVVADTKSAEAGLDRFTTKVSSTGQKVENAGKKMTVFAGIPIAAAMGMAVNAASDLNETLSKSNTVFGSAAKEVENWADTASDSFGQSKREALGAASSFGNLFVQLGVGADQAADMSIEMTELASDFASFHNADITEVIDAQTAAFRGEYDALQRFVPTINAATVEQEALAMTGKRLTSELTAQEKALAVQKLMLDGAGDALGDFDRTADSAANQLRTARAAMEDASAEIGTALLPIVADLAGGVADLANAFGDLPDPVQKGVLAIAGLAAAAGPLLVVGGRMVTLWPKIASGMETVGIAALMAKDNLGKFALQAGAVAAATIAVTKAIDTWASAMAEAGEDASSAASQIIGEFDAQGASVRQYGAEINRLVEAYNELSRRGDEAVNRLLKERFYETRDALGETITAMQGTWQEAGRLKAEMGLTEQAALDMALGEEEAAAETKKLAAEEKKAVTETERLEKAIRGVNDAFTAQFDPLFAARSALRANQEAQWAVMEATDAVTEAQRNYNDVEAEFGKKSPEAQYAYHQLEDANRRLADAKYETAEAALDAQTATSELARKMAAGEVDINKAKESLRQWVDQGLITEDQANQTAGELDNVARQASNLQGRNIVIPVDADTSGFLNKVSGLYQNQYGEVSVRVGGGGVIRHSGGPTQPHKAYVTGGKGREELFVPNELGRILSTAKSHQLLGGGGGTQNITVNLNGGDHDASSVASHIAWMLGR
jgi:hypothetical protein